MRPPGREKERGQKAKETGPLEEALDMNLKKHYWQELEVCIQHALHSLQEGGGTRRAFRRPHLGCLEAWRAEWLGSFENKHKIAIFDFLDAEKLSFGEVWEACLRVLGYLG